MRECNLKNAQKFNKNRGWFARMQKGVFCHFWGFGVFCFSVFLCFCFVQYSPKWLFSCIFRVFCLCCFPKRPVLNCFFSSRFVFFFAFVFPFKNPCVSLLFVHQPLLEKTLCGVSFVFLLLAFSFPNVCLFI